MLLFEKDDLGISAKLDFGCWALRSKIFEQNLELSFFLFFSGFAYNVRVAMGNVCHTGFPSTCCSRSGTKPVAVL